MPDMISMSLRASPGGLAPFQCHCSHLDELTKQLRPALSKLAAEQSTVLSEPNLFDDVERLRIMVESGVAGPARSLSSATQLASEILTLTSQTEVDLADAGEMLRRMSPTDAEAQVRRDR